MNRRAFFATIAAGLAASADPERLLWVPGRKLISIPPITATPLWNLGKIEPINPRNFRVPMTIVHDITRSASPRLYHAGKVLRRLAEGPIEWEVSQHPDYMRHRKNVCMWWKHQSAGDIS
jgi:hypothetical protein